MTLRSLRGAEPAANAARRVGVVRTTWLGWETGRRAPDAGDIQKIAIAYGLTPAAVGELVAALAVLRPQAGI